MKKAIFMFHVFMFSQHLPASSSGTTQRLTGFRSSAMFARITGPTIIAARMIAAAISSVTTIQRVSVEMIA